MLSAIHFSHLILYSYEFLLSELIYRGQRLNDEKSLDLYGVKQGVTIYALKRSVQEEQEQKSGKYQVTLNYHRPIAEYKFHECDT